MASWRRQKGESYKQEFHRPRSYNNKPPLGHWQGMQATVPSWEKKFCSLIGSVSWRKLLDTKKYMHLYDNVVQWNDSAGEEAFDNAKQRFWAEINGESCHISLPDPDIYIDKIDWNSNIDPELLLDLEQESNIPDSKSEKDEAVVLGSSLLLNQPVPCTGWGDAEEIQPGLSDHNKNVAKNDNPWEINCAQDNGTATEKKWENSWNDSWGCNEWEDNVYNSEKANNRRTDEAWGQWSTSWGNGEGNRWHMSRYKTSRLNDDDYRMDSGWRNGKWRKRTNYVYERPIVDRKPASRQWKMMNSCQPLNQGSGKAAADSWNFGKAVS